MEIPQFTIKLSMLIYIFSYCCHESCSVLLFSSCLIHIDAVLIDCVNYNTWWHVYSKFVCEESSEVFKGKWYMTQRKTSVTLVHYHSLMPSHRYAFGLHIETLCYGFWTSGVERIQDISSCGYGLFVIEKIYISWPELVSSMSHILIWCTVCRWLCAWLW